MKELFIILLLAVTGTLCCVCFFIGAKVGQKVSKGEEIKLPSINPVKAVREHEERRAAEREQTRLETIMENIEAYDGTGYGQRDV